MKKEIKAVVFDLDGVVIKAQKLFSEIYSEQYGIGLSELTKFFEGRFRKCTVGESDLKEELSPFLEKWGWDKTIDEFLNYWFKNQVGLDEDVLDVIKKLGENNIKCIVATNQEKYRAEYLFSELKIVELFEKVCLSCKIGAMKPDDSFYDFIISDLSSSSISPGEVVYWDDKDSHVRAGNKNGWSSYLFDNFIQFEKTMKKYFDFL